MLDEDEWDMIPSERLKYLAVQTWNQTAIVNRRKQGKDYVALKCKSWQRCKSGTGKGGFSGVVCSAFMRV